MSSATDNTARAPGGGDPRVSATGPHLSEAARLAAGAHRMLVDSLLSLKSAAAEIVPAAEAEIAGLLKDGEAYASELLRVAGGMNALKPRAAVDEVVRDPLEGLDLPEIPFSDAPYRAMWDRVAADWRERNRFRHLRDYRALALLHPDRGRSSAAARLLAGCAGNAACRDRSFQGTAGRA